MIEKLKQKHNGFQGDVIFIEIDKLPKGAKKIKSEDSHILQSGSATGHKHQISLGKFDVYEISNTNQRFIKVQYDCEVTHEEHKKAVLYKGNIYEIRITLEYDYDLEESKQVVD